VEQAAEAHQEERQKIAPHQPQQWLVRPGQAEMLDRLIRVVLEIKVALLLPWGKLFAEGRGGLVIQERLATEARVAMGGLALVFLLAEYAATPPLPLQTVAMVVEQAETLDFITPL
jgi:hypothetical protein